MPENEVHVTALYTDSARKATFVVEQSVTLQHVINEAYNKLEESKRADDKYLCHDGREDLSPYLHETLAELKRRGICVHSNEHGEVTFFFDIDAKQGGA